MGMMLHLEVTSFRGLPPEQPAGLHAGNGAYTLGRNPDNDLALGDPERLVSGRHARIEVRDDGVWIFDQSTNGTFLNQSADRLPPNQPVALHDGDSLSIGAYELAVTIVAGPGANAFDASDFGPAEAALPGLASPGPAPDIMNLLGGSGGQPAGDLHRQSEDPFADAHPLDAFLEGPAAQEQGPRAAEPRQTPVEHVFFRPPEVQSIPDDYDLLSDALPLPGDRSAGAPSRSPEPPRPLAEAQPQPLLHEEPVPSVDLDLSLDLDLDEGFGALAAPSSAAVDGGPLDELPNQSPHPSGAQPGAQPRAKPRPATGVRPVAAADVAPQADRAPPPVPSGGAPAARAEPGPHTPQADLLAAFLAGLGCGDTAEVGDPAAFLQQAGALLRAMTAGLSATMMARSQFKSELRLGVTTIRRAENNPFKFSVTPEEAMERLLLRPNPAYLPALDAARESFEDIQAHEMAMIAGLRAALRALLARFEPSALEARLEAASGLDKLLPMARKSRYWDQFTAIYGQVAADAAEDFMQLFGEAFTRAYEDQVLRLAQARGRRRS